MTAVALLLMILLWLPACQGQPEPDAMRLDKAALTQEEDNIMKLLDSGPAVLYDYTVDSSAKRLSINSYRLDDQGEWQMVSGGGGIKLANTKGRIALSFGRLSQGLRTAHQDSGGTTASSYTTEDLTEGKNVSVGTSYAPMPEEIVYEQELPIAVQVISENQNMTSYSTDAFFHPEQFKNKNDEIYAVTVLFSKEPVA